MISTQNDSNCILGDWLLDLNTEWSLTVFDLVHTNGNVKFVSQVLGQFFSLLLIRVSVSRYNTTAIENSILDLLRYISKL